MEEINRDLSILPAHNNLAFNISCMKVHLFNCPAYPNDSAHADNTFVHKY